MHTETTIDIDAPPERVWEIMTDVVKWPEWTASVKHAEKLYEGPMAKGSKTRLAQPKVPAVVWTVTDIEPGRFFKWEADSPAIRSVATHRVEPSGDGSKVTLTIDQSGPFTVIMGWWLKSFNQRFVDMEAKGLKARAEAHNGYAI